MLPFVGNDYLWQTGLAGSIPSMVCYIVATVYLFLSIRLLTKDSRASFVGTLVFILNPNVLYLQATPLSELACFATLSMACYYFLRWVEDNQPKYLAFAAGSTFFATLARYDGWWLYLTLLCFVGLVGWRKRQRWRQIEGNMVLFGLLGGLGIGLWLLWDALIFGDPLYFQHGPYSSQEQQLAFLRANTLYTYHDLLQSFRYYTQLSIDTLGPIIFVMAALAVVNFASHHRSSAVLFGALAFLTPLVCYIVSLYTGQVVLYVPETVPDNALQHLYNARFGAEMVPPAALFLGYLACRLRFPTFGRFWEALGQWAMVILIITQVVLVTSS